MPSLELTEDERDVLKNALESYVKDLGFEISNTERRSFRDPLKSKREVLLKIIEKLS
ncbi:hypothetical protein BH24PSE2_BH24PSE2_00720 [soil metagenome]